MHRISSNTQVANFKKEMVVRKFLKIEASQLLELDDSQTGIECIEFADLNVGPIDIVLDIS